MRRVVVIDDHQPLRRHLVNILNSGGYEIAGEGASGKIALALARSAVPDVILMAVGCRDVDGIEKFARRDARASIADCFDHQPPTRGPSSAPSAQG